MTEQTYPPVEPHWPLGRVAQFYLKRPEGGFDIGMRELVVTSAARTETGWLVTAELPAHIFAADERTFEFEVDEDGESTDCVPWDDELDREYVPPSRRRDFTEEAGTVPVRLGEPSGEISDEEIKRLLGDPKHAESREGRS